MTANYILYNSQFFLILDKMKKKVLNLAQENILET